ncbi:hypothetical protein BV898_11600 [Hypsibius exemplaris]|uniref:UPAR/Ly6 domain-containing protein n=1 Tax=Hypsibius exemplaris TaxID=2072580 RepID=A0A1W0WGB5_HYPEX|nr:hypothetical protein BV898_11600 [Hypsibius exemplaris]
MKFRILFVCLTVGFYMAPQAAAVLCYVCSNNGTNPADRSCLDVVDANTKQIECAGVCIAVKAQFNGVTSFVRNCQNPVNNLGRNSCVKVDAKVIGNTCVCEGNLCNGQPQWDTATTSASSIKCHSEISGRMPGGAFDADPMTGTVTCSAGSCTDIMIKLAEGNSVRQRSCTTSAVPAGCTDRYPAAFTLEAAQFASKGAKLVKFCACSTSKCNANVNSGTGSVPKNGAGPPVVSWLTLLTGILTLAALVL